MHLAEVRERRSSCERVTDNDELVGRMSLVSRLPQLQACIVSQSVSQSEGEQGRVRFTI